MGSRGSVIPFFLSRRKTGVLPITDERMTRFNISLAEGVDMVLYALEHMWGGEIYVPRIPSYRILDVAAAIGQNCRTEVVGIRPGEKLHEEMITETDGLNTLAFKNHFVILPAMQTWDSEKYRVHFEGRRCEYGFKYNSGTNEHWLSVEDIRALIRKHMDPQFTP
jgi:FlaA1/EpsC-like NDP-sugar epimerase